MKVNQKQQSMKIRINNIEKTIQKFGVCSINSENLTHAELATLREHFTIEHTMGYLKFKTKFKTP